ncbi:unnamed protein product [Closterium sp. NIES-53]
MDIGYQVWQYIMRTYKATDNLYISQLEKKLTIIRMGGQESVTEYCNRARRVLADLRMAGVEYSVASYATHVINGLPSGYNLVRRMLTMPSTCETLNEDPLSSHIIQDEFMQESEWSTELLPQAKYVALTKQGCQTGQRGKSGGGGGGGGNSSNTKSTEGADQGKSANGNDRGSSGSRRGGRRCYICGDPDHLSYDYPDRDDSDDDQRGSLEKTENACRSEDRKPNSNRRRRDYQPRKEKPASSKTASESEGDTTSAKEASCSMVGMVEPTILLAPEVGEDFQAVTAAVQANLTVVLLDSGFSHQLMGTREAFVDMKAGGEICHVRGFNGALQNVEGRGIVALTGETGKSMLIPDMLYVPGVHANLLSGQLKESGVKLQDEGDEMLLKSTGADLPCASCVGGKLARHNFPEKGLDAKNTLDVVHIDLCGPFRVAAADGSLYYLLLKPKDPIFVGPPDRENERRARRLREVAERSGAANSTLVKRLCSDRGVEFLGKKFTDLVEDKGILHNLTCPYTPQQNGMAEREMHTVVEAVQMMLLHMGVKHYWWHLALRHAIWVRNCLKWASLPPRTMPYELLFEKKSDLTLACMCSTSPTTALSQPWKVVHGPASVRTKVSPLTGPSPAATLHLVAEDDDQTFDSAPSISPPSKAPPPLPPSLPSPATGVPKSASTSAASDEGSIGASPSAPPIGIAGGQHDLVGNQVGVGVKSPPEGELLNGKRVSEKPSTGKPSNGEHVSEKPSTEELSNEELASKEWTTGEQSDDSTSSDVVEVIGELSTGEQSSDSDVLEVSADKLAVRRSTRSNFGKLREKLSYHACLSPTSYSTLIDDAQFDVNLPELDPNMHANPVHCWDIANMTVNEALASWKGKVVKAVMDEEIRSLISSGTWELVERPRDVNVMKNCRVLMTKYHVDDTAREKTRLVVKGFTQVYGADYDKTYAPVGSYITLRIFLSIFAVLDLHLMQLDMKNAFLQSKLDRVLYMDQPAYYNDGTGRVCKLLKSLYGLKQSPLLWYSALNAVLTGAGWSKSQVDEALYFKVGDDGVVCWVLVYVDDPLAASSSTAMLKELLEAAFELREISLVEKYLGLEIVRDRSARKLWLHHQSYVDKVRRHFIDEEQTCRRPKTPVSVDAYAELTFDNEDFQSHKEEEHRQKVGSLQFATATTRPDIAFACSKVGSGLMVRSDQHWREVDRWLTYLADMRDFALENCSGPETLKLVHYADADDAGDKQTHSSTNGYVFTFGGAAYIAATEAGKEARRLRFLLAKFQLFDAETPTTLNVDNQSTIAVAEGLGLKGNLKHMERCYAWLHQMVKRKKKLLE